MTTYARVIDHVAVEIFIPQPGFDIGQCFVPQLAVQFSEVPDGTVAGSTLGEDGTWTPPAIAHE
jgi:hypothetical protein